MFFPRDFNGNVTSLPTAVSNGVTYNYDNKLRSVYKGSNTIAVKYDPMGNRVYKNSTLNGVTTNKRFIVDINSELPVVLCVTDMSGSLEKSYYHIGAQIIAQQDAAPGSELYYYIHDRLGSVRAIIDTVMQTAAEYSYDSFGKMYTEECYEAIDSGTGELLVDNPFKYTGQYYDAEIDQYYVRARQYDPTMRRFTGRDPQQGNFKQTMTLHRYLYCWNNPTNLVDLNGKSPMLIGAVVGAAINVGVAIGGGHFSPGEIGEAAFTGFMSGLLGGWLVGQTGASAAVIGWFGGSETGATVGLSIIGYTYGVCIGGIGNLFKMGIDSALGTGSYSDKTTMAMGLSLIAISGAITGGGSTLSDSAVEAAGVAWVNYWGTI